MSNYKPINWNKIHDMFDKMTWEKLTEQFWLDTRMPVSNDRDDWRNLPANEQWLIMRVFGGLTFLDTLQSENGVEVIKKYVQTPHERAVLNNIEFMESVHAKSYSSIFSTLNSTTEIDRIFAWTEQNEHLQKKAEILKSIYAEDNSLKARAASVLLESFLFYSGFYTPLYYLGQSKLPNVAEVIKMIIRDEAVHGTFIGLKFQNEYRELPKEEQEEISAWVYETLFVLYENEVKYSESLYDEFGLTEEVKVFLRYNANKALMNLGLPSLFPDTAADVNPIIMNGLSTGTSNHDFFSQTGNGYLLSAVEVVSDNDYASIQQMVYESNRAVSLKRAYAS